MTWKEKYRRDSDLAESIIETLEQDLKDAEKRIEMLEFALERIRDYHGNWALSMRQIAREALK
jgi:predicted RNase H-like nuclease (RuvC/YqgF family)